MLKFESVADNIGQGMFKVKIEAFFNVDSDGPTIAPPIAYIDANVAFHGLHKISKIKFMLRPEDRPILGSEPAGYAGAGYAYVSDEVESLILPSADPNADNYEPMFFYQNDPDAFGYFVESELIVNISQQNPVYFRWGSAIENKNTALMSSELTLIKFSNL